MSTSEDLVATTDSELLTQFVRRRDEGAFRGLVERHAALVMGVCRHVTQNEQDAEDAFQATLLILVRRADRLLHVSSLGAWLHRVAFRTALRAAHKRARKREKRLLIEPVIDQEDALREIHTRELQRVLHEELANIAERYRSAIVLCDLEGKTRQEAAEQLDCTEAAVKANLARGRRRLRIQMLQRGALLSVGMIAANRAVAAAQVTPELLESTVALCRRQISSDAGTPAASDSVQGLTKQGVELMSYSTVIKPFVLATVAIVLVTLPFALLGQISDEPSVDTSPFVVSQPADGAELETPVVQAARADAPDHSQNTTAGEQEDSDREETRIEVVTTELLETLRQLVRVNEQLYEVGAVQIDTVIRARQKLFEAQLDLAGSRPERIRILEARMQSFRELEKAVEQQHGAGRSSTSQLLATKAERLEAELDLLREQALSRENSKSSDRD